MEITEGNIEKIKEKLQYLYDNFNIEEIDDPFNIGDEDIYIAFPRDEYMETPLSISDFFLYTEKIDSLKQIDSSTVRSDNIRQTIISNNDSFYNLPIQGRWITTDDYLINIVENPFYIGLIAAKEGIYNEDFGVYACSSYHAIEIVYLTDNRLSEEDEFRLISQLLFALSHKFNDSIAINEYLDWAELDEKTSRVHDENNNIQDILIPYSSAMDIYIEALSINNNEIRFLYFYKIVEYYSPIVAKKTSYELLNQKLDVLSISRRDHKYLDSIFDLTRRYDLSIRDKELAFTILINCIDIAELYQFLPESIRINIGKIFQFQDINILNEEKRLSVIKKIANILYSTRNSFVHAKSNYFLTGDECKNADIKQLNVFMSKLCYCLIVWNGRQHGDFRI